MTFTHSVFRNKVPSPGPFLFLLFFLTGLGITSACDQAILTTKYFGKVTGFPSDEITALVADSKGTIFVGTKDKGLVVIPPNSDQWSQIYDETKALSFNAIHSLWIDQDQRLWIGTAGGLNSMDISAVSVQSKWFAEDGMKDNIVLSISKSPNNSALWIGTTLGLVKKEAWFQRLTEKDGLCSDHIQSLIHDADGDLWIGTADGLMIKNGLEEFKTIPLVPKESGISVWVNDLGATGVNVSGRFFQKDGYYEVVKKSYEAMLRGLKERVKPLPKLQEIITGLLEKLGREKSGSTLYAAANSGLYTIEKGNSTVEKLHDGWFTALAVSQAGRVYAANNSLEVLAVGMTSEVFPEFKIGPMISSVLKQRIRAEIEAGISEDSLQPMDPKLLATLASMSEEQLDEWIAKTLFSKSISSMCFDFFGNLWVGLEQGGVFRFNPQIVNKDSFLYAIMFNREAGGDLVGVDIKTPKPELPDLPQLAAGAAEIKAQLKQLSITQVDMWIGKWSQLQETDCIAATEFIGKWSHPACVVNLARFLPYDPYVIIPMPLKEPVHAPASAPSPAR